MNGNTGVSFCSVSVLYRCNEHYTRQEASSDECDEMWLCYLLVYKTYLKVGKGLNVPEYHELDVI